MNSTSINALLLAAVFVIPLSDRWLIPIEGYFHEVRRMGRIKKFGYGECVDWREIETALQRGEGTLVVITAESGQKMFAYSEDQVQEPLDGTEVMTNDDRFRMTCPPFWCFVSDRFLRQRVPAGSLAYAGVCGHVA